MGIKTDTTPHIFEGFGIELEYMIVNKESLDIFPISDKLIKSIAGKFVNEVEFGNIAWSNELALHVIEIKNLEPVANISGLPKIFQEHIKGINSLLAPLNAMLMPTGMHPWMDPFKETRLWTHGNRAIYDTYNRIFDCRGHGWSNVQSVHLNLSFNGDEEFKKLHTALRILLPILPALSASSPILEGKATELLDSRLEFYRNNQRLIPSITGHVIPEPVSSRREYEELILKKIYRDIAPHDPEGILQHEWLNSRGAIARFDRSAIEIRILDTQECPIADIAIAYFIISCLKILVEENLSSLEEQASISEKDLEAIFLDMVRYGNEAIISNTNYLSLFLFPEKKSKAKEILKYLHDLAIKKSADFMSDIESEVIDALKLIILRGPLSTRIKRAMGGDYSISNICRIYKRLCLCLSDGLPFKE